MYRDFTHQAQAICDMRYSEPVRERRHSEAALRKALGRALIGLGARLSGQSVSAIGLEHAGA